jgi:hypothetical protein
MNGLIAIAPYPHDVLDDCFVVTRVGTTFALVVADARVLTQQADGSYRPSQAGDVLSRTPRKSWEGRLPGTNGIWEQASPNGSLVVYNPAGTASAEEFRYAATVPNV